MRHVTLLLVAGAVAGLSVNAQAGDFRSAGQGSGRQAPDAHEQHRCKPEKSARAEAKSAAYGLRSQEAAVRGNQRYADKYADKSERYAEKAEKYGCGTADNGPPPPPPEVG